MEDNGDVVDGPEDDASDSIPSHSGPEHNEPDSNATLSDRVFHAAKDGMALTLFALLADQARPQQEELLASTVRDDDGQECPPIVIAARNGHEKTVSTLIAKFGPGSRADPDGDNTNKKLLDLEVTGTVKFDGYTIEGATALWSAAGAGHLKTVQRLVKAGAEVNHTTTSNSTPLRAACFEGKLDIVAFLVEEGRADVNIANKYDNTCLMISAYKGHEDIVRYLLKKNANVNAKARCGATALHFASETGKLGVVKILIEQGHADINIANEHGVTALLAAADRCQEDVVEYLLTHVDERQDLKQIDAYELLGASFANDKDNYDLVKAFHYLEKGMSERWEAWENLVSGPILKPPETLTPSHRAYNNRIECASPEDLEAIRESPGKIHMEGLAIRERILGKSNPELPIPIIFRGAVYADLSRFERCIALWLHALHLRKECKTSVAKDLLRFTQVFSQMLHVGSSVNFQDYLEVLKSSRDELKSLSDAAAEQDASDQTSKCHNDTKRTHDNGMRDMQKTMCAGCGKEDGMEQVMVIFLYLVALLSKNQANFSAEEMHEAMTIIHEVVAKIRPRNLKGKTLVHFAVDSETPVDDFHINDVCKFPCAETTKILLDGGADATAMDCDRNTPLHVIVSYQRIVSDFMTLHSIIGALIEAGAHADVVNMNGQTPMQKASTGVAEIILKSQARMNLKCLSAQAVKRHHVSYQGQVPQALEDFIELHGP